MLQENVVMIILLRNQRDWSEEEKNKGCTPPQCVQYEVGSDFNGISWSLCVALPGATWYEGGYHPHKKFRQLGSFFRTRWCACTSFRGAKDEKLGKIVCFWPCLQILARTWWTNQERTWKSMYLGSLHYKSFYKDDIPTKTQVLCPPSPGTVCMPLHLSYFPPFHFSMFIILIKMLIKQTILQ